MPETKQPKLNDLQMQAKLAAKKNKVVEAVKYLQKDGKNKNQNYNYVSESQTVNAIRGELVKVGLSFAIESDRIENIRERKTRNGVLDIYVLHLLCSFTDTGTGFRETHSWFGESTDMLDKAISKAYTAGQRHFLLKNFLIPTGDDPEATEWDEPNSTQEKSNQRAREFEEEINKPPKMHDDEKVIMGLIQQNLAAKESVVIAINDLQKDIWDMARKYPDSEEAMMKLLDWPKFQAYIQDIKEKANEL